MEPKTPQCMHVSASIADHYISLPEPRNTALAVRKRGKGDMETKEEEGL